MGDNGHGRLSQKDLSSMQEYHQAFRCADLYDFTDSDGADKLDPDQARLYLKWKLQPKRKREKLHQTHEYKQAKQAKRQRNLKE